MTATRARRFTDKQIRAIHRSTESNSELARRFKAAGTPCTPELIRQVRAGILYPKLAPRSLTGDGCRTCDRCHHWHGWDTPEPCDLGHTDWQTDGVAFGRLCATWRSGGT